MTIPLKYRIFTIAGVCVIAGLAIITEVSLWFFWFVLAMLLGILIYMSYLLRPVRTVCISQNSKTPFISVVVPVKNEEKVIERLLKDVLGQEYPKYELIVVDDNSTDRTWEIIERYAENNKKVVALKKGDGYPPGKPSSLNIATGVARGEWILVLDADARLAKNFLKKASAYLEGKDVAGVQTAKMISNRKENWLTKQQYNEYYIDYSVQLGKELSGGCVELKGNGSFVKKNFLKNTGGWDESSITEDLELSTRIAVYGKRVRFAKDVFVREQAVRNLKDLFHQRTRWIQGSLFRYYKYMSFLFKKNVPLIKKIDFIIFAAEFALPLWVFFDLCYQGIRLICGMSFKFLNLGIIFLVLTVVMLSQMMRGFTERGIKNPLILLKKSFSTALYLLHWFPVVICTTFHVIFGKTQKRWKIAERSKI